MVLDILNDDDRIIDNETDRKHHSKEGQCIDGKIQQHKCTECSNERYRYRKQRYKRCAPTLQKEEDNKHNKQQGLYKGMNNLCDGRIDVIRTVKDRLHLETGRECFLRILEYLAHLGKSCHRIRIGGQLNTETDGRITVEFCNNIVASFPGLNARNIFQADECTVLARSDDDIAELLRRRESSLHLASELLLLSVHRRHTADRTCRCLHILLVDRRRDVCNGQPELCEAIRIHPDAHRIVRTEYLHLAHAVDTLDRVEEVERRIVLHECTIIRTVLRVHRNKVCHLSRGLARCNARRLNGGRKARICTCRIVLYLDSVHVAVCTDFEGDGEAVPSRIIGGGAHIVHPLGAVDLLLDDLRHRLIDNSGTCADIVCRNGNGRRRNLRVLRNRQRESCNRTDDDNHHRNDDCKDRPMYEKFCQRIPSLLRGRKCARVEAGGIPLD